ncbi:MULTISPECIES: hypothetical protein [Cellulophaga]|uniref:Uncharacterized protein n=2 Tax=Cellulophaga TaxID=104264 RepID=F0RAP9_CELLC|nr:MULTISPECIES: hypothetical protein [Cellulophaga]ADY28442.1 hypothetical protein Celly_0607 [Cellulophaga lytica DSM 7489]AIM59500.1 hypothetical protein IX49_02780 [Cellulophaga lytica]APU09311.1 hypothetical protein A5M85_03125 [Cellulophaga lytica]EWH12872.1 hypothetical protein KLA_12849 [Cellulophaga geojensis KL-A]MDO6854720.1 hypothetical protein [Cellulophaga lytica]
MKNNLLALFLLLTTVSLFAQENDRTLLRGTVIYRDINVPNLDVINVTAEDATLTDKDGDFEINVKIGDQLVFTSFNYQIKIVFITEDILKKNRLVVDVNEKVTELDEVVVSPEDQEKFVELKNEEFKEVEYEIDRTTTVTNIAQSQIERGMENGINFVNIFKALTKSKKKKDPNAKVPEIKLSRVLRQVYEDDFFVKDLGIPQDKIDNFLQYCDDKIPSQTLLKKSNEFQLIDFLVTHSKEYKKL